MLHELLRFRPDDDPGGQGGGGGGNSDPDPGDPDPDAPGGRKDPPGGDPKDQMVPASELEAVRKEAAKYRTERNAAQKKADELEKAQLSDAEKVTKERDELKTSTSTLEKDNRSLRARLLAGEVGIVADAQKDAAQLLDWSKIDDPSDDDQVKAALETLTKDKPYLLGTAGGADGGSGGRRTAGSGDMNSQIRRAAGRSA